jgi:hypothetical protein
MCNNAVLATVGSAGGHNNHFFLGCRQGATRTLHDGIVVVKE